MKFKQVKRCGSLAIWLVTAGMVVVFVAGCSPGRKPIQAALVARARAQAKLVRTPRNKLELAGVANGNSDALLISPARYESALQKIDVERCPADFKAAWQKYLAAWQADNSEGDKLYDISALAASTADGSSAAGSADNRLTAWHNLQKHLHGVAPLGDDF